ncbi:MAG: murein L,D-transpeptidase catalytic domain family protein [Flavobacterium sp.]|nr:murein L,D-transpeptidase catalytic domain family protein [Flavobacterium sp.]
MKKILLTIFVIIGLGILFIAYQYRTLFTKTTTKALHEKLVNTEDTLLVQKIKKQSKTLRIFAQKNHYNKRICFLVDMNIHSGKNRFFVYNMQQDSIELAGLVAHGSGNSKFTQTPSFSNEISSGCTSLGKYKVSYQYKGKFGKAYKLNGLDSSNSNAFERNVVLHAYSCVPNNQPYPLPICNSLGCPMVSYTFLEALHPIIAFSKQPILLYIYH